MTIVPLRILEYYRDQLKQDIKSDIYVGKYYNTQLIIERQIELLIKSPIRNETAYKYKKVRVGILRKRQIEWLFDEAHNYDLPSLSISFPRIGSFHGLVIE